MHCTAQEMKRIDIMLNDVDLHGVFCPAVLVRVPASQGRKHSIIEHVKTNRHTDTGTPIPISCPHHETLLVPLPPIPLILRKPHNNKIATPAQGRPLKL